jgi:hypothetical protein
VQLKVKLTAGENIFIRTKPHILIAKPHIQTPSKWKSSSLTIQSLLQGNSCLLDSKAPEWLEDRRYGYALSWQRELQLEAWRVSSCRMKCHPHVSCDADASRMAALSSVAIQKWEQEEKLNTDDAFEESKILTESIYS